MASSAVILRKATGTIWPLEFSESSFMLKAMSYTVVSRTLSSVISILLHYVSIAAQLKIFNLLGTLIQHFVL